MEMAKLVSSVWMDHLIKKYNKESKLHRAEKSIANEEIDAPSSALPTTGINSAVTPGPMPIGKRQKGSQTKNQVPSDPQIVKAGYEPDVDNVISELSLRKAVATYGKRRSDSFENSEVGNDRESFDGSKKAYKDLDRIAKKFGRKGVKLATRHALGKTFGKDSEYYQNARKGVNEVLAPNAKASDYIDDFVHSKNKKFAGKSKKERIRMALGAYYGKNKQVKESMTMEEKNIHLYPFHSTLTNAGFKYSHSNDDGSYYHRKLGKVNSGSHSIHTIRVNGSHWSHDNLVFGDDRSGYIGTPSGHGEESLKKHLKRFERKVNGGSGLKKESVVSSIEDVYAILEAYAPSDKLKSRTKYLVVPKLSKTLRDRLEARNASKSKAKKKGYTPSARTLAIAAMRKAEMSGNKKKVNESVNGIPTHASLHYHLDRMSHGDQMMIGPVGRRVHITKNKDKWHVHYEHGNETTTHDSPYEASRHAIDVAKSVTEAVEPYKAGTKVTVGGKRGVIDYVHRSEDPKFDHKYKVIDAEANDSYRQKRLENGNFINHSRIKVTEETLIEAGSTKTNMKRKYLGKMRGRTLTGQKAHAINTKPTIDDPKTSTVRGSMPAPTKGL